MKKSRTAEVKLWKVIIGERLDVEQVNSILKETSETVKEMGYESILEIQRIDIKKNETVIFISERDYDTGTLVKTLKKQYPKARAEIFEAMVSDLQELQ